MNPALPSQLTQLWVAEFIKLQSRLSARITWVLLAALGIVVVLFVSLFGDASFNVNGEVSGIEVNAGTGLYWGLWARTFFIGQAALLMLGASSFAGEFQTRTLREALVRPVPRWGVLLAKWGALSSWSGISLIAQGVLALLLGAAVLGTKGDIGWSNLLLAHGAVWLAEISVAAMVLMAGTLTRSVQLTVAAAFLFLVLDRFLGVVLWGASGMKNEPQTPQFVRLILEAAPFAPSHAWHVWQNVVEGQPLVWESWASLFVITILFAVVAERAFARMDVP